MSATARKKRQAARRYGWQVVTPEAEVDEPSRFEHEFAHPRVYLDRAAAEAARAKNERAFIADRLADIRDAVEDWNYEDEVADTFLQKLSAAEQRAFVRAFLPKLWAARGTSWLAASDDAVRRAFRDADFAAPRRAAPLAWAVARRLLDPYLPWPELRRVALAP